jgi:hypothetical protein
VDERNCVILDDFNISEIDWMGGMARGQVVELLEVVEESLMEQLVRFTTHLRGNVMDLVKTNISGRVMEVTEKASWEK